MEAKKPNGFGKFDALMRKLVHVRPQCPYCRKADAMEKTESPSGRYTEVKCRFCNRLYGYGE